MRLTPHKFTVKFIDMRKLKVYFLGFALLFAGNAFSQATSEGDTFFDFGVGVGRAHSLSYYGYSYAGVNSAFYGGGYSGNIVIPTISVSLQKAFWDDITIGGFGAFNVYGHNSSSYDAREMSIMFGAKGEYHFNRLIGWDDQYDLYAGVLAGARIWNYKVTNKWTNNGVPQEQTYTANGVGSVGGVYAGFRYYFSPGLAVYAEAGYAVTSLRAGLCWKF